MSEAQLPTEEEIAKLPRWARVAFAARCARRAQPLFQKHWPDAPEEHVSAIEKAIHIAEHAAARAAYAETDAQEVGHIRALAETDDDHAADAARAAAAAEATAAKIAANISHATADAADAVKTTARAGVPISLIAHDFQTILETSQQEKWTDEMPVPPSVFGPLDVESSDQLGFKEEVKVEVVKPTKPLRLFFEKNVFKPDEMAEMIGHLSELYHTIGGDKLIIDDIGTLYPEQTPITSDVPEGEEVLV